ncbi:MAG: PQQ-binding-like beta-propeller repeat protein, partial [Planctomycetota bacterium]|nr:PQQ-binding-like beta-propeller repeat protein [Planctomycetota bacterium]
IALRAPQRLAALAAASLAVACSAQEWTRLRGPKGQGHGAAELPAALTKKNVRWRVDAGEGHSSPVLWGDRVFLTRLGEDRASREVVCYDADTGAPRWSKAFGFDPHDQHKLNNFAASTPAVDADGVYLLWTSGARLLARSLDHDGAPRWEADLGAFYSNHGSAVSPVLCGELVIVANENQGKDCFVTALDRGTGEPRWRIDRQPEARWACYSPPFLYEPEGAAPVLLLASFAHGLTAIEPESGELRWEADLGFKNRFIASPCLSGELLLVNTGSGDSGKECVVFDLAGGAEETPEVRYRPRRGLPYVPSAIAVDGMFYLFADSGFCSGIDAASGERLWRVRSEHRFFSSPVTNGRAIYIGDREGHLLSFALGRHERLSDLDLGAPICATPALARGCMFVRTARELICLGRAAR